MRLICTDSLSHTRTRNLVKDSLRLAQIRPASLRVTQIHLVSRRFARSHSDPPNLSQIEDSLDLDSHSDLFSLPLICADSCSPTQIHTDSPNCNQFHSDSLKITQINSDPFSQIHLVSLRIRSGSHRLIQIHSLRFAQMRSNWPILKERATCPPGTKGRRQHPDST